MRIEQVRNAALIIDFAGKRFLTDPWLQESEDFIGTGRKGPAARLPKPAAEILKDVDAYVVTHIHGDHFDLEPVDDWRTVAGGKRLDKDTKMFVQNEEDKRYMQFSGFRDVDILSEEGFRYGNVELIKTSGVHGTKIPAGSVMGIVFKAENEKTLYVAGDTIYCDEVEQALLKYRPDIVVTNACAAYSPQTGRLIMDGDDLIKIHQVLPEAVIIASHMECVRHATLTRADIRMQMEQAGIAENVKIPMDGEVYDI